MPEKFLEEQLTSAELQNNLDKSVQAFLKIKSLLSEFGIITANNETEKLTKL